MAQIHQKRLIKKYGEFTDYKDLMARIIATNSQLVTDKVLTINNDVFVKENAKVKAKEKLVVLPDVSDVISPAVNLRKAAERGELITANLRQKLTQDLREVLLQPDYIRKRGKMAGTLKTQLIKDFQSKIKDTFENYTKINPEMGVPSNIRNIAVTEVRAVINPLQHKFMSQLQQKNPDLITFKTWIHNRGLSKQPRPHHKAMNGTKILFNQDFILFDKKENRQIITPYPHHESMDAGNVIGCSCEVQYQTDRAKNVESYDYRGQE